MLRGQSPATRLFPPDLIQFSIGAMAAPRRPGAHDRDGMSGMHGRMEASDSGAAEWTTVPMPRGLTMLPAEMALRPDAPAWLPSGPAPLVRPTERVRLASGDTLRLEAAPVRRTLDGRTVTMYAFNGQQPGPLIEVARGAEITVRPQQPSAAAHDGALARHPARQRERRHPRPDATGGPARRRVHLSAPLSGRGHLLVSPARAGGHPAGAAASTATCWSGRTRDGNSARPTAKRC